MIQNMNKSNKMQMILFSISIIKKKNKDNFLVLRKKIITVKRKKKNCKIYLDVLSV